MGGDSLGCTGYTRCVGTRSTPWTSITWQKVATSAPTATPTQDHTNVTCSTTDYLSGQLTCKKRGQMGSVHNFGEGISAGACRQKCCDHPQCSFVDYRGSNRWCTGYTSCDGTRSTPWTSTTWQKVTTLAPTPTPTEDHTEGNCSMTGYLSGQLVCKKRSQMGAAHNFGQGISAGACQQKCCDHPQCSFVNYRGDKRWCTGYKDCVGTRSVPWTSRTWKKAVNPGSYTPVFLNATLTCSSTQVIGRWITDICEQNLTYCSACAALCDANPLCNYWFQNDNRMGGPPSGDCLLYTSCGIMTPTKNTLGATYRKCLINTTSCGSRIAEEIAAEEEATKKSAEEKTRKAKKRQAVELKKKQEKATKKMDEESKWQAVDLKRQQAETDVAEYAPPPEEKLLAEKPEEAGILAGMFHSVWKSIFPR